MISRVEALHYRALRYVQRPLGPFHVLVGPNASGKTTFLDVIAFLGRLVDDGVAAAIAERTENFHDLTWGRNLSRFELAIEAAIPPERRSALADPSWDTIRYEVAIGLDEAQAEPAILVEKVLLKTACHEAAVQRELFPQAWDSPLSILSSPARGVRTVVSKTDSGNDNFSSEVDQKPGQEGTAVFRLGRQKSALGHLPEDETKFPAATWLKQLLQEGVQPIVLNSLLMRKASPPAQPRHFKPDGANLPWVIESLQSGAPERFADWIAHLATALPDLQGMRTVERADDRHRYVMLQYAGGLEVPSWMASDGTLRLIALTLPAHLSDLRGIFLIEEPENGIHPRAIESVYHSLASMDRAQVLLATHSPVILSNVEAKHVLCFAKTSDGAVDIVSGDTHPKLRDWKREENLGVLFAAGVLG